jgi:predicted nucleic acid-binding protein
LIIVIDASVVGHWLLTTKAPILGLVEQFAPLGWLAAPYLLDAEVSHVIRRHALIGRISTERAQIALEDYLALPIERYPHMALLPRAFELRDNATMYDALYLALVESLAATLLTRDKRLVRVPGVGAQVDVVSNGV